MEHSWSQAGFVREKQNFVHENQGHRKEGNPASFSASVIVSDTFSATAGASLSCPPRKELSANTTLLVTINTTAAAVVPAEEHQQQAGNQPRQNRTRNIYISRKNKFTSSRSRVQEEYRKTCSGQVPPSVRVRFCPVYQSIPARFYPLFP